jgi:tetratricopeptide (TPR) repeat protein
VGDQSSTNLKQLDPLFMYSRLFKQILFDVQDQPGIKEQFIAYLRDHYGTCRQNLDLINEFDQNYQSTLSIRYYSKGCFRFGMVNSALREMQIDALIKSSFFLYDIDQRIKQLQASQTSLTYPMKLYRGQAVLRSEFDKLQQNRGSLLSFNNFISTSRDPQVARIFCPIPSQDPEIIPLLFHITIEKELRTATYANIDAESQYGSAEKETLFSMHTVFRIDQVTELDGGYWQVEMSLTDENDPVLQQLSECIRQETQGSTGWSRLGQLLVHMGHFNEAHHVYVRLIESSPKDDHDCLACCYHQLGTIASHLGRYQKALSYYETSLDHLFKASTLDKLSAGLMLANMDSLCYKYGRYSLSLSHYKRSLDICEKMSPPEYSILGVLYSNVATVYREMGQYRNARQLHDQALAIREGTLPANHLSIAASYENIALVEQKRRSCTDALVYYEKAYRIQERALPSKHPQWGRTYNKLGTIHDALGNYSEALSYYKKHLAMYFDEKSKTSLDLLTTYTNMAAAHERQANFFHALQLLNKTLTIRKSEYPEDVTGLARTFSNLGYVHENMGKPLEALKYYQEELSLYKTMLSESDECLAVSLNNIGAVHDSMEEHSSTTTKH